MINDVRNEDLYWFWNEASGDMGLRASPLEPSTGGQSDGMSARQLKSAARYNRVSLVLGGLDEDRVRLLRLVHTEVPPALRPRFSKLGTLAMAVVDAAPSPEWVLTAKERELQKLTAKVRREATKAVKEFEAEYRMWVALEKRR